MFDLICFAISMLAFFFCMFIVSVCLTIAFRMVQYKALVRMGRVKKPFLEWYTDVLEAQKK